MPPGADHAPDLLSLVLELKPLKPAQAPPRLGRAAQAVLLARLAERDPDRAAALHDGEGPKPFTCSSLLGARVRNAELDPSAVYTLRYTALEPALAALLPELFPPGSRITFEGAELEITAQRSASESPWASADTYNGLLKRYMLPSGAAPAGSWSLLLASPTAFQSQGRTLTLPEPRLVFGSLVERWNACAPLTLPAEEVRTYAAEMVAVNRFTLNSAVGWERGPALRLGAVGQITFHALNHDRYWRSALSLLAAFSLYSGVGALTTVGMGQVRQLGAAETGRRGPQREPDDGRYLDY